MFSPCNLYSHNIQYTVMTSKTDRDSRKFPFVPHGCLFIDATWKDVLSTIPLSMEPNHRRSLIEYKLERLWNHQQATPTPIMPCLSVRTALDLFLNAKKYPPGSELIFGAVNIPDMARIVRHHGLKVVSVDIDTETLAPKTDHLDSLINPRTVAILVAHIYGRWSNIDKVVEIAKEHGLTLLEDCAEAFCGLRHLGHPGADVSFFSFGLIKPSTAFGGAITVVRNPALLTRMKTLYNSYPIQERTLYLKKVLKYSVVMMALNTPAIVKYGSLLLKMLGMDHKEMIVTYIRGFPAEFFSCIRMRPSTTLLYMLYRRLKNFDASSFHLGRVKGDFVTDRLPSSIRQVGMQCDVRNYWLFPILVNDPDRVTKELNDHGIDAYRGSTQLSLIESDVAPPTAGDNRDKTQTGPQNNSRSMTNHGDTALYENSDCNHSNDCPAQFTASDVPSFQSVLHENTCGSFGELRQRDQDCDMHLPIIQGEQRNNFRSSPGEVSIESDLVTENSATKIPSSPCKRDERAVPKGPTGGYPNEARYLIDHVVYLPVHKRVSFHYLEQICAVLEIVMKKVAKEKGPNSQSRPRSTEDDDRGVGEDFKVNLKSKL